MRPATPRPPGEPTVNARWLAEAAVEPLCYPAETVSDVDKISDPTFDTIFRTYFSRMRS